MTSVERHADALADLDRQIALERERLAGGRHVVRTLGNGMQVLALVYDETSSTLRGLEGRRRILERHAPKPCGHCPGSRGHYVCVDDCEHGWPSQDWRDAAGLADADPPPDRANGLGR